jgi:hypothetical protein
MEDQFNIPYGPQLPPYGPQLPTQASQERPSAPSLMDLLRQRVERNIANEPMQRLTDLGAGMLANPNRNFFTMLGGGLRAQSEGERSRMQELRQVADAERQAAQQQAEEAYRREQNRINEERYRDQAPYRAAQAREAEARAALLARTPGGTGGGGGASREALAAQRITAAALRTAAVEAERAVEAEQRRRASDPTQRPLTPDEANAIRDVAYERFLLRQNVTAPPGALGPAAPPPPPAPAAQIDARGNPIR